jgi:hypothetical protein
MMRPNMVGWILAGFFLVGGIAFFIFMPEIWIGQIWIAVAVFLIGIYVFMNMRGDRMSALRRTGTPANATILEMTQTGIYINEMPQVRFKLRVQPTGGTAYEMNRTMTIPHIALGSLGIGKTLDAYIDKKDPSNVMVDWYGSEQVPGQMPMSISQNAGQPMGINDPVAQQAVMQALGEHGIDTSSGTVDLRKVPGARAAVLAALQRHGVDAAHSTAAADPTTSIEDKGTPMDRMAKLKELRAADLITQEEFEQQRRRVLEDI